MCRKLVVRWGKAESPLTIFDGRWTEHGDESKTRVSGRYIGFGWLANAVNIQRYRPCVIIADVTMAIIYKRCQCRLML